MRKPRTQDWHHEQVLDKGAQQKREVEFKEDAVVVKERWSAARESKEKQLMWNSKGNGVCVSAEVQMCGW